MCQRGSAIEPGGGPGNVGKHGAMSPENGGGMQRPQRSAWCRTTQAAIARAAGGAGQSRRAELVEAICRVLPAAYVEVPSGG